MFKEGLCRLCTAPYVPPSSANIDNRFMHLTNYAINKANDEFVQVLASLKHGNRDHACCV
jgi:hypothetical protein